MDMENTVNDIFQWSSFWMKMASTFFLTIMVKIDMMGRTFNKIIFYVT